MNYDLSVGQVIYLLANNEPKVYPALITEQIDKKTLTGKETSYVVRLPTEENVEVVLEKLEAEVFTSIEEIRSSMLKRAMAQIDKILESSSSLAKKFDEYAVEIENSVEDVEEDSNESSEYALVDLGDGTKGRIRVSDIPSSQGAK